MLKGGCCLRGETKGKERLFKLLSLNGVPGGGSSVPDAGASSLGVNDFSCGMKCGGVSEAAGCCAHTPQTRRKNHGRAGRRASCW